MSQCCSDRKLTLEFTDQIIITAFTVRPSVTQATWTLKLEAICSAETSVPTYRTTQCNPPSSHIFQCEPANAAFQQNPPYSFGHETYGCTALLTTAIQKYFKSKSYFKLPWHSVQCRVRRGSLSAPGFKPLAGNSLARPLRFPQSLQANSRIAQQITQRPFPFTSFPFMIHSLNAASHEMAAPLHSK